jgi:DNA-binding response OmpR family regulator
VTPDTILVVDADLQALGAAAGALADAGYIVMQAASFPEARRRLAVARPDVLVTAVRLGGFNGFHLVIGSRVALPDLVTIVTHSAPDPVLQSMAARYNATFLVQPITWQLFLGMLRKLLDARGARPRPTRNRRWPRTSPAREVDAAFGVASGTLVDLSYGGVRLSLTTRLTDRPCRARASPCARARYGRAARASPARGCTASRSTIPTTARTARGASSWTRHADQRTTSFFFSGAG